MNIPMRSISRKDKRGLRGRFLPGRNRRGYCSAVAALLIMALALSGCSGLTGWRIPGTEKSAVPTTKTYLVLENVETIPENLRARGEIYVDDAFFGRTSRPEYSRFVGNDLVVGSMRIEKEKTHTIRVEYPGYESFEHTRFFGALAEYSISFRLKRLEAGPATAWERETLTEQPGKSLDEEPEESRWYEFWGWFGE